MRLLLITALALGMHLAPMTVQAWADAPDTGSGPDTGGWTVQDGDLSVQFTPDSGATTLSASGCNVDVCIYLTGSGLTVDRWRTTGYVTADECSRARFWANGDLIRTSSLYCPSSSGALSATWDNPGRFSNGTKACNSWTNVTGYPCKTIYE